MRILFVFVFFIFLVNPAFAGKGRKSCSGSNGGVKHCTVDHKFMCNDVSISASKKRCG